MVNYWDTNRRPIVCSLWKTRSRNFFNTTICLSSAARSNLQLIVVLVEPAAVPVSDELEVALVKVTIVERGEIDGAGAGRRRSIFLRADNDAPITALRTKIFTKISDKKNLDIILL